MTVRAKVEDLHYNRIWRFSLSSVWHGASKNSLCRQCEEDEETVAHILYHCPASAAKRLGFTGEIFLETEDILSMEFTTILSLQRELRGDRSRANEKQKGVTQVLRDWINITGPWKKRKCTAVIILARSLRQTAFIKINLINTFIFIARQYIFYLLMLSGLEKLSGLWFNFLENIIKSTIPLIEIKYFLHWKNIIAGLDK